MARRYICRSNFGDSVRVSSYLEDSSVSFAVREGERSATVILDREQVRNLAEYVGVFGPDRATEPAKWIDE